MVAGHLQEKKGNFYIVISYKDESGKRKSKWIPTGLPVKGNKKRAEALLIEARNSYVPEKSVASIPTNRNMLFSDFLWKWLKIAKSTMKPVTYASYVGSVKNIIVPYFSNLGCCLFELSAANIQEFYAEQLERVKAVTVIRYHAIIHRALEYAVKMDLILSNPADKVELPRKERFVGNFYDSDEINALFNAVNGSNIEIPVKIAAFYGLRRSEVIGLKWSAIDFKNNTISIQHTVTVCNIDGKSTIIASDTTKTKSSMRTLPLVPEFRSLLINHHKKQEKNRQLCGRSYCMEYLDYVCVNELGERIDPNYLSKAFTRLLQVNGLRKIRFHDLRHSCASLLLANGVSMKQIQEWMGHSDFSTTANIYAHLDVQSKRASAEALIHGLHQESISCSGGETA